MWVLASILPTTFVATVCVVGVLAIESVGPEAVASELAATAAPAMSDPTTRALAFTGRP
jgi:hypothetical protein